MAQILSIHFLDVFARHLIHQSIGHILVLADSPRHLDADTLFFILQVGPVAVDQMGIMLTQQRGQCDHGITLKEAGIEFWFKHRFMGYFVSITFVTAPFSPLMKYKPSVRSLNSIC